MVAVGHLLKEAVEKLREENIDTPQLDAEVILCHLLQTERIQLHIYPEREVEDSVEGLFWKAIEKRKNHMPVQYIVNHQEFMGLDFWVEEGVLIPRGDTEILIEEVLNVYNRYYADQKIQIIDIGTGSGAITVSLAKLIEGAKVFSIDVSPKALSIGRKNAAMNKVEDRITFLEGSLFTPLYGKTLEKSFDFIVSNPPYISKKDMETLPPQVKNYEPSLALAGGEDGLDFYRQIVKEAPDYLKNQGWLAFEIGHDQGESVKELMEAEGFKSLRVVQDLAGLDRVVIGQYFS